MENLAIKITGMYIHWYKLRHEYLATPLLIAASENSRSLCLHF